MALDHFVFVKQHFQNHEETVLKRGGKEEAAIDGLQQLLADEGYYKGKVDGIFGKVTERAVKAFQEKHGLEPSGIVTEETFETLAALHETRRRAAHRETLQDIAKGNPSEEVLVEQRLDTLRQGVFASVETRVNVEKGAVMRPVESIGDVLHNLGVWAGTKTHEMPRDAKQELLGKHQALIGEAEISLSEKELRDPDALKAQMQKLASIINGGEPVEHDFDRTAQILADAANASADKIRGK